jgi:hypothetical protein
MNYKKLNYSYKKDIVLEEIFQHRSKFVDIPASKEFLKSRPFSIVDESLYDQVTTVSTNSGIVKGTIPSWKGFSFTYVPTDPITVYGGNMSRIKHEIWQWKPESNCPYIQEIVKDLGFTQIQNIRAMIIEPPGFGPVHCDVPPTIDYYKDHTSITLNLEDGGLPLIAKIQETLYEFNDPCFIFEDNCWHGVGQVSSRRTQLRINGIVDKVKLNEILSRN